MATVPTQRLLYLVPIFVVFVLIVAPLGALLARGAHLDAPGRRAVIFSCVTRNSLVVLPLTLALPAAELSAPDQLQPARHAEGVGARGSAGEERIEVER